MLTERLDRDYKAVYTAEPSGGKTGVFIRNCCLYDEERLPTAVEALLFAADRVEHVENEIKPALNEGKMVICDRYIYSSLAYQGSAGVPIDWIKKINDFALKPDLAFFIDVPPEQVLERLQRKKSVMETLEIQKKAREVYMKFVDRKELLLVQGDKPKGDVAEALYSRIVAFMKAHR